MILRLRLARGINCQGCRNGIDWLQNKALCLRLWAEGLYIIYSQTSWRMELQIKKWPSSSKICSLGTQ